MKKMKKFLATLLASIMMLSTLTLTAAAEGEAYEMFVGFGGDFTEGSWDAVASETVTASAKVGDTVTIGLKFDQPVVYTWWMAPVLVAEGVSNVSYTIDAITVDGKDVLDQADLTIGEKEWWYEGTGDYSAEQSIRLKGGVNEWADKYLPINDIAAAGYQEIMYTITLNDITFGGAAAGPATLSDAEYPAFLAIGAGNDWQYQYYGEGAGSNAGVASAVEGVLKSGETTTLSVTFEGEADYTWFVAPCFIVEDPTTIAAESTFDVKAYIDDTEIAVDMAAGKAFWAEDTGDFAGNCVRIAGGYNEWGDKYIAESPVGYTTIKFEITPQIYVSEPVVEEETSAAGPVDLNGEYNAYLGLQTPKYSFRNAFDDATYGRDSEVFNQITGWDAENNAIVIPGTFTDAKIAGNGTYTVSVEGMEFPEGEFDSQAFMNLIFLSTDIPNTNEITISDVELKVNGKSVELGAAGAIVSPDSKDYLNMLLQNIWNTDVKEIGFYDVPMEKMSITFTVSGFAYDKAAEEAATPDVAPEATPEITPDDAAPVEAPAEGGSNMTVIIIVVVAVVAVAAVAGVVVAKKKKN